MIVFTNGCFDILHPGHIDLLTRARALGEKLIVGLNSDSSVRAIKGPDRPIQTAEARKAILLGLRSVDEVIIFEDLTPADLIQRIKPDILVKGGDWKAEEIVGADLVTGYGGRVVSLPLYGKYSSTALIEKMAPAVVEAPACGGIISDSLKQHAQVFDEVIHSQTGAIADCASLICETVRNGKKVLVCGNGGSAADAQHIAAELTGRYESERRALPAIALTTDTSALTAIGNDYGFERIFARQIEALAVEGDCLIAISTSGTSPNVIAAAMEARKRGCRVVGMTGSKGKKLASISDACIIVPASRTARIQEVHITVAHIWCEMVDAMIEAGASKPG